MWHYYELTPRAISKDKWDTKEDTGKSTSVVDLCGFDRNPFLNLAQWRCFYSFIIAALTICSSKQQYTTVFQ